jgi:hypothetical protein
MADPTLPPPLEIQWTLASTTQPLAAGDPDQTSISLFFFEPDDANLTSVFPDQRLIFLKFTVSVSPATIPGAPPVTALGEGVPCLHLLLDLKIRKSSGELGTIRPYFHAAAPTHRTMIQTGVVGVDTYEGESDQQSVGRSGSQMYESSSTHARTTSASLGAGFGIGGFSIGGAVSSTSTDVSGSRAVSQQIDTTQREASEERRELISHLSKVENVLTLLNAKYVGTPFLSFSLSPQPLQLLSIDPGDPNLWFSQLLARRSSGIEGIQEYTAIVLVPKGEAFCVNASLRRVCVLDVPPGPLTFEPFNFQRALVPILLYLDRVYPAGTPLEELDVDLTGSLPNPQTFPRPVVEFWVISAAGYMIADIVSPPPGPNLGNVSRTSLAYKHMLELWLEVQRDEYERAAARSPIERGVLVGETRSLDTCFAFAEGGLTVSNSATTVSPLTHFIVDPPLVDLGGVTADASAVSGSVKVRAYEAATRWNLLDGRLATLLSNRRSFPKRKLNFGDEPLLSLVIERWARLLEHDPRNLALDEAARALKLSGAQKRGLKAAGATDLRSIGQLLRAVPVIERYNERLGQLRALYRAMKAALPDTLPTRLSASEAEALRKTLAATLAKASAAGDRGG